jgi:hypothetical protein
LTEALGGGLIRSNLDRTLDPKVVNPRKRQDLNECGASLKNVDEIRGPHIVIVIVV